jgi:hypothetical protein
LLTLEAKSGYIRFRLLMPSMNPKILQSTVWLLVLSVPIALLAEVAPGILNVQGSANVNGTPIAQHGNIFPGDRLQTMAASNANITADSYSVTVPENSSVVYGDNKLDLGCGGVNVTTLRGTEVRAVGLVVKPVAVTAKFGVYNNSQGLTISPTQGAVTIDDGKGQPITVAQGQSYTRHVNSGCTPITPGAPGSVVPIGAGALAAAGAGIIAYCTVGSFCHGKSVSAP